jgi:hypothetical protein
VLFEYRSDVCAPFGVESRSGAQEGNHSGRAVCQPEITPPCGGETFYEEGDAISRELAWPTLEGVHADAVKPVDEIRFQSGKLVLTVGDEGLRDLLRPEEIERRGYFEPRQCEQLAAHNQFFALDHVFIIQLMDELFVSHFPTDSAAFASPLIEVLTSTDLAPWRAKPGVEAEDVLALNPAVFGVVTTVRLDLDTLTLPPAEVSDAVFSQADRATVALNPNCLVVLAEIDGRRSCEEIYAALQDALSREDLFDELARLVHEGVLMHRTASDKNPAESLRSNRVSHERLR